MGMDIYIIREAKVDGKWKCCEPLVVNTDYVPDNINKMSASVMEDIGRYRQLFGILAGEGYMTLDSMLDYPNGLPSDLSEPVSIRINEEERLHEEFLVELHCVPCVGNKKIYYNCTFKEMEDYLQKWRNDMIETGSIPLDFINEEGEDKLHRFNSGIYKRDVEKRMQFMCKLFDDAEYNPLVWFLKTLNETKCGEEFKENLKDIKSEDKRIIFWFSW